jgi:hypothetical protein
MQRRSNSILLCVRSNVCILFMYSVQYVKYILPLLVKDKSLFHGKKDEYQVGKSSPAEKIQHY